MDEELKQKIDEILTLLRGLGPTQISGGLLKKKDAAGALGIGITKLKGLIRRGEIATRWLGGRELIPHSEVLRLGRPDERRTSSGRAKKSEYDPVLEAELALKALKKRS